MQLEDLFLCLYYKDDSLKKVCLRDIEISVADAHKLALLLPGAPFITELSLEKAALNAQSIKEIAEAIPALPNLMTVSFSMNPGLGDDGAKLIAQALPRCPRLFSLSLSSCNIGDEGAAALEAAIPNSPSLKLGKFSNNKFTNAVEKKLSAATALPKTAAPPSAAAASAPDAEKPHPVDPAVLRQAVLDTLKWQESRMAGAKPSAQEQLVADLVKAVVKGDQSAVLKLLESGVDVNGQQNVSKSTALHAAVACNKVDIARLLCQHGANPLAEDIRGTPLDAAKMKGEDSDIYWVVRGFALRWKHDQAAKP